MLKKYLFLAIMTLPFFATAQPITINYSDCLTGNISASSQIKVFNLPNVAVGDIIIIRVTKTSSSSVRPCVKIYFPGNSTPNTSGCSNAFVQYVEVTATAPGIHIITVEDFSGFFTGDFNIFVERGNMPAGAQSIACETPASFQIDCQPEMVPWKFAAQPNSLISINANSTSSVRACIVVRDYLGTIVASDVGNQFNANVTFTTYDGTQCYYVFVFDFSASFTGSVNLTVVPITGACTTASIQTMPADGSVCLDESFTLNATSPLPNATYTWSGPNGFTSNLPEIIFANADTAQSGTYTVTVTAPAVCTSTASKTIVVHELPTATASVLPASAIVCAGLNFMLDVMTDAADPTYKWSGPNGYMSPVKSPIIATSDTSQTEVRVYTVTVTDGITGCTDTSSISVQINAKPTATITSPATNAVCFGATLMLDVSTNAPIATYLWSGPNGFTSTLKNPSIPNVSNVNAGTYTVTVWDANGCSKSANKPIVVNILPSANVSVTPANGKVCMGQIFTLAVTTNAANPTFQWNGPNGFTSTMQTVILTATSVMQSGDYIVIVTNGNTGCSKSATIPVDVILLPTITLTATPTSAEICSGGNVTLCLSSDAQNPTFHWTGPGGYSSTAQCVSFSNPNQSGVYTATSKDGLTGCTSSMTNDTVTIHATPIVNISQFPQGAFCEGDNFMLCAVSNATDPVYAWTGPGNLSSSGLCVTVNGAGTTDAGNYKVTVTDAYTCQDSADVAIDVNQVPIAIISGDLSICSGALTELTAAGGGGYTWSNGSTGTKITVSPAATTTYTVTVTNSDNCTSTTSATVEVSPNNLSLTAIATGSSIQANTAGGMPPYTYSISPMVQPSNQTGFFGNLANGIYTITVSDNFGCSTSQEVTVQVINTVNPGNEWGLSVSPNPSNGLFEVILKNAPANSLQFSVFDGRGYLLRTFMLETIAKTIDLMDLPTGLYVLRVSDGEKFGALRLVIAR